MQVKSIAPLSLDWIPPSLIARERELKVLLGYAERDLPQSVWVQGEKGFGKSLTAKIFKNEVEGRKIGKVYTINCESSLKKTLRTFSYAENIDVEKDLLKHLISRDSPAKIFFIIDDFQKPHPAAQLSFDNFIFSLCNQITNSYHIPFSFTILSQINYSNIDKKMKLDTLSRLQLRPLVFGLYNADEIERIIMQRIEYSLERGQYEAGAINLLCAYVRRIGGDMRKAINMLYDAILSADKILDEGSINQAWEKEKTTFWKEQLGELAPHTAFFLYQVAKVAQNFIPPQIGTLFIQSIHDQSNVPDFHFPISLVTEAYRSCCTQLGTDSLSLRMEYYMMADLEDKGYIQKVKDDLMYKNQICVKMGEKPENIIMAGDSISWSEIL